MQSLNNFRSFFRAEAEKVSGRILSLLDRDPFSNTYGCFDKNYWGFRDKDFPNSAAQMSSYYLCLLSDMQKDASRTDKMRLAPLILASFQRTWQQQNRDGSFDEWYPGEHGWGGPTGYILYTQCKTLEWLVVQELIDEDGQRAALDKIECSARFLVEQAGEVGKLTNHFAIVLAALSIANSFLQRSWIADYLAELEKVISDFFVPEEGWSTEYDGLDVSYNMATLSFLGKADEYRPVHLLYPYIESTFETLPYFLYPDGTFSGSISTRRTEHLYPHALTYWANKLESAQYFLNAIINSGIRLKIVTPDSQDDHYVHYLSWEFFQASYVAVALPPQKEATLPFQRLSINKLFPKARIYIRKIANRYLVISLTRGGSFKLFCTAEGIKLHEHCGYVLKFRNQKIWTSLWQNNNVDFHLLDSGIKIQTEFAKIFQKQFSVLSSILFRLFFLLVRVSPRLTADLHELTEAVAWID